MDDKLATTGNSIKGNDNHLLGFGGDEEDRTPVGAAGRPAPVRQAFGSAQALPHVPTHPRGREFDPRAACQNRRADYAALLFWLGGDEEDRTPDLRIANATLSQLSYVPD
jgi:hypothetical protein